MPHGLFCFELLTRTGLALRRIMQEYCQLRVPLLSPMPARPASRRTPSSRARPDVYSGQRLLNGVLLVVAAAQGGPDKSEVPQRIVRP